MSEHYFSNKPQSQSNPQTWNFELKGNEFSLTTDHGVFSKKEVDFGSRTLIDAFTEPQVAGDILDLGCGYGPIGLSLAKAFPERKVILADVNERALALAEKNAAENKVENIEVVWSDRLASFQNSKFAAVVTNPPIRAGKAVIYQMFEESYQALVSHGELWVVIQKKQGAPSAYKELEQLFEQVDILSKNKGYYIIRAIKIED